MMHAKSKCNFLNNKFKYSIFRILGNETPPRDDDDARLKSLQFILDNEPEFPNTIKCWIVNCIHDKIRRELICKMLSDRNMYYVIVPIVKSDYVQAKDRRQKIRHLIGINRARNFAIKHGRLISNISFVLDGDCMFNQLLWDKTCNEIELDQSINLNRKIYSIPTSRSRLEHCLNSDKAMLLAEPMLAFRSDNNVFFDESIPFGEGDKLKLLYQLGHSQEQGKHHLVINESYCKSVGLVHHITFSDYDIELNQKLRTDLRNESMTRLMWQVDNPDLAFPELATRRHNKPNQYWSTIQGWFDFRGLYSQFAYEQHRDCKFVEVGSWLGASICYLATEFKNRNKFPQIYSVDTWEGSNENIHFDLISKIGGKENLYHKFLNNLKSAGVDDIVTPIRMQSVDASKLFEDESLDVVFIDASHSYQDVYNDIFHWYPKVKKGGIISGHDYVPGHLVSEVGVVKAVNEFFLGKNLEIGQANRSWLHVKK